MTWQQQDKKAIATFLNGLGWKDVYTIWRRRISDFVAPTTPLFLEVLLHDPGNPHRDGVELAWWPRNELNALRLKCQQHFDDYPGTLGPTHPNASQDRKGELQTLEFLWEHKDEPEQVAAVLLSASIFSRLYGRKGRHPEKWPLFVCVEALSDMINERWRAESGYWHHASTFVLPYSNYDYVYQLDSLRSFVTYLAEEHAALLHQFAPVVVRFASERVPMLTDA